MGNVSPRMYDDDTYICLPDDATKLLWHYLLLGSQDIPGLIRGGVGTLAEAMRWANEKTEACVQILIQRQLMEIDAMHRLIRVANAPSHNPPGNQNVLRGWYRRWLGLADCALRERHVSSLELVVQRLIDHADSDRTAQRWKDAWADTFAGRPKGSLVERQVSLPGLMSPQSSYRPGSGSDLRDPVLKQFRHQRDPLPDPEQDPEPKPDPDARAGTGAAATGSSPPIPIGTAAERAHRWWRRQEELRSALGLPPVAATVEHVTRVAEVLAGATDEQVEHVLQAYFQESRADPDKGRHFNGHTNWKPKNFVFALSLPVGAARSRPQRLTYAHPATFTGESGIVEMKP